MQPAAVYLFVPGSRLDRLAKAAASGADAVIIDLEDGVAGPDKASARDALADLPVGSADAVPILVRLNGRASAHHDADVDAVAQLAWVSSVVLPMTESADDVHAVAERLPQAIGVAALVETAAGLTAADEIARSGTSRLLFGSADYLADIDAVRSREALAYPRARLVVAARAAGLPAAVDGPALVTTDHQAVLDDAREARALGMRAKLCIHPAQIAPVRAAFGDGADEQEWAAAVLDAAADAGGGAFAFRGEMVDEPVLVRARQIVQRTPT